MRRTVLFLLLVVALIIAGSGPSVASTAVQGEAWRYCYANGSWWYWLPEGRWVYWQGERWHDYGVGAGTIHPYYGNALSLPGYAGADTTIHPYYDNALSLPGYTAADTSLHPYYENARSLPGYRRAVNGEIGPHYEYGR